MLILLISSYCKMCTLPTLRSRVSVVCCEQYKHARSYCWQWTQFTIGTNEQNQHFAELRQKVCQYKHVVVLPTCLPSLNGKLERFVTKKWQKWLPNSSQTDYSNLYFLKHVTVWGKMKFTWHGFYVWIWKITQIMLSYQTGLLNQWYLRLYPSGIPYLDLLNSLKI